MCNTVRPMFSAPSFYTLSVKVNSFPKKCVCRPPTPFSHSYSFVIHPFKDFLCNEEHVESYLPLKVASALSMLQFDMIWTLTPKCHLLWVTFAQKLVLLQILLWSSVYLLRMSLLYMVILITVISCLDNKALTSPLLTGSVKYLFWHSVYSTHLLIEEWPAWIFMLSKNENKGSFFRPHLWTDIFFLVTQNVYNRDYFKSKLNSSLRRDQAFSYSIFIVIAFLYSLVCLYVQLCSE